MSPIQSLDLIFDLAVNWIVDSNALILQGLVAVAQQEELKAENEAELRQLLKTELRKLY